MSFGLIDEYDGDDSKSDPSRPTVAIFDFKPSLYSIYKYNNIIIYTHLQDD